MTPLATPDQLNLGPEYVIPVVIAAMIIGIAGGQIRRLLTAMVDELAELWRTYGPVAMSRALERRPRLAATPWYCRHCASYNGRGTTQCYRCGARREEAQAPVPDADVPAGASAGLTQRTRRNG